MHRNLTIAALGAALFVAAGARAQQPTTPPATSPAAPPTCTGDSAYHVLDFWIGHWTVVDSSGARLGTNAIERVLGGCAITESWKEDGGEGRSLFYYVPTQRRWKQVWVTASAL